MSDFYILEDKTPKSVSMMEWAMWVEQDPLNHRRIAWDEIETMQVSTVFLGMNHGYNGQVLLFETMVFGEGEMSDYQERYETYDEALEGHARIVAQVNQVKE